MGNYFWTLKPEKTKKKHISIISNWEISPNFSLYKAGSVWYIKVSVSLKQIFYIKSNQLQGNIVQSDCAFSLLDMKISSDALAWQVVFALDMVPGFSDVFISSSGKLSNGPWNTAAYLQPGSQSHEKVSKAGPKWIVKINRTSTMKNTVVLLLFFLHSEN